MSNAVACPICGAQATYQGLSGVDGGKWSCTRCGEFDLTGTAESILRDGTRFPRTAISGWIRDQNRAGTTPAIHSDNLSALAALQIPTLQERLDRYLLAAVSLPARLGGDFNPSDASLIGASYSDSDEVGFIVRCMEEAGFIQHRPGGRHRLTPQGYIAADELRARRASSSQAFVAMWLAAEMADTFDNGFALAIASAGYEALRIDKKEHANKVDDEIIAEIRRSAFVVADFTGHRGGVYFEAGFAMGLGLPVIWTCRKDHLEELHFDIRQYNCIDWQDKEELKSRLRVRIEALLGKGPLEFPYKP